MHSRHEMGCLCTAVFVRTWVSNRFESIPRRGVALDLRFRGRRSQPSTEFTHFFAAGRPMASMSLYDELTALSMHDFKG